MLEGFTWFKQSALLWRDAGGPTVYIDPWEPTVDDPADLILITHAHYDHYQPDDIARLRAGHTRIVAPRDVAAELTGDVTAVQPGDSLDVAGVKIQAVPAYNIVESRLEAHPRSNGWVGYVLTLGGRDYYHAGDTDHLPELESLRVGTAFVPIGGTYTMDAGEAAGLVRAMGPDLAVPMHYGFVVGRPPDADRFAELAAPVQVQIMRPARAFEQ